MNSFISILDGSQEVPSNNSLAYGFADLELDPSGTALSYNITIVGLDFGALAGQPAQTLDTGDDVTGLHLHPGARGVNAPVAFGIFDPDQDLDDRNIAFFPGGAVSITGIWEQTDSGNEPLSNFIGQLQNAAPGADVSLYLNTHTQEFPAGEIRGQIVASNSDNSDSPFRSLDDLANNEIISGAAPTQTTIEFTQSGSTQFSEGGANFQGGEISVLGDSRLYASGSFSYVLGNNPGTITFDNPATSVQFFYVSQSTAGAFTAEAFDSQGNSLGSVSSNAPTSFGDPANFVSFESGVAIARIQLSGGIIDNFSFSTGGGDPGNNDLILGLDGNDTIAVGAGNDIFNGNQGNDILIGGSGNDGIFGGKGDDILIGVDPISGLGSGDIDRLSGDLGNDTFVLGGTGQLFYNDGNTASPGVNDFAVIHGFTLGQDTIQLNSTVNYVLDTNLFSGSTVIRVDDDGTAGLSQNDEVIGVVKGVTGLTLNGGAFTLTDAFALDSLQTILA